MWSFNFAKIIFDWSVEWSDLQYIENGFYLKNYLTCVCIILSNFIHVKIQFTLSRCDLQFVKHVITFVYHPDKQQYNCTACTDVNGKIH